MKNTDFTLVQFGCGGEDPMRQKDMSTGRRGRKRREGGKKKWGGKKKKSHSVSFEPVSPCWAEFDIQTMRQGSTQGGRLPCNINSHLESSCGYGHETLKETAAMDPVPSHHHSHCLAKRPPHCSLKPAWTSTQTASYSLCGDPADRRLWATLWLREAWMPWELRPNICTGRSASKASLCRFSLQRTRKWYSGRSWRREQVQKGLFLSILYSEFNSKAVVRKGRTVCTFLQTDKKGCSRKNRSVKCVTILLFWIRKSTQKQTNSGTYLILSVHLWNDRVVTE